MPSARTGQRPRGTAASQRTCRPEQTMPRAPSEKPRSRRRNEARSRTIVNRALHRQLRRRRAPVPASPLQRQRRCPTHRRGVRPKRRSPDRPRRKSIRVVSPAPRVWLSLPPRRNEKSRRPRARLRPQRSMRRRRSIRRRAPLRPPRSGIRRHPPAQPVRSSIRQPAAAPLRRSRPTRRKNGIPEENTLRAARLPHRRRQPIKHSPRRNRRSNGLIRRRRVDRRVLKSNEAGENPRLAPKPNHYSGDVTPFAGRASRVAWRSSALSAPSAGPRPVRSGRPYPAMPRPTRRHPRCNSGWSAPGCG